jgi:hypothetical protein
VTEVVTEVVALAKRVWPHVVAVFVVFHVLAVTINTIPDVRQGLDRRSWQDGRARREIQMWADRLGMQREDLEKVLAQVGTSYQETRSSIVAPFDPYMRFTGMKQAWAMFGAGTAESDRFGLRMRRCALDDVSCDWEDLYIHADDKATWRSNVLGHPRLRSAIFRWSWPGGKAAYHRGCDAIAFLVLKDFPDAAVVQCRFERSQLPSPWRPNPSAPVWSRERNVDTSKLKELMNSWPG